MKTIGKVTFLFLCLLALVSSSYGKVLNSRIDVVGTENGFDVVVEREVVINSPAGKEVLGDLKVVYWKARESVDVLEAWTETPSGKVVKVGEEEINDVIYGPYTDAAGVYGEVRMLVVSFPSVEIGAKLHYKYVHHFSSPSTYTVVLSDKIPQERLKVCFKGKKGALKVTWLNASPKYDGEGCVVLTPPVIEDETEAPPTYFVYPVLQVSDFSFSPGSTKAPPPGEEVRSLAKRFSAPAEAVTWIEKHVHTVKWEFFRQDFRFSSPDEVLRRGFGSPADVAYLVYSVLKCMGKDVSLAVGYHPLRFPDDYPVESDGSVWNVFALRCGDDWFLLREGRTQYPYSYGPPFKGYDLEGRRVEVSFKTDSLVAEIKGGRGKYEYVERGTGDFDARIRGFGDLPRKDWEKFLSGAVKSVFGEGDLVRYELRNIEDPQKPAELRFTVKTDLTDEYESVEVLHVPFNSRFFGELPYLPSFERKEPMLLEPVELKYVVRMRGTGRTLYVPEPFKAEVGCVRLGMERDGRDLVYYYKVDGCLLTPEEVKKLKKELDFFKKDEHFLLLFKMRKEVFVYE